MIGPEASAAGLARRSSSRSATSRIFSSSSSRFSPCLAETFATCVVPPHSSGWRPWVARSARTRSGFAPGQIDLVDGDHDRHVGGARVRDRLERLRHHAVVGGDDQHRDVGDLGAAGTHGGERLVARCVEERQLPAVDLGLVGADVLRDPAGLGVDDRGLADRVEQGRLAVVDVAHDRHDRRPRDERLLGVVERLRLCLVVVGVLDRHLAVELEGDHLHLFVGERLGRGLHRPQVHQHLDDLRHRDPEGLREVAQRDAGLDGYRPCRRRYVARGLRDAIALAVARTLALARAGTPGAAVDDDAPSPVSGASAPSWSDRSTAWHGSSVEPREGILDADNPPQRSIETSMRPGALETDQSAAGVDAASGPRPGYQHTLVLVEALELGLRRLAAAARAGADRLSR